MHSPLSSPENIGFRALLLTSKHSQLMIITMIIINAFL